MGTFENNLSKQPLRNEINTIQIGRIVDTNDPLQMGRVRVFVPTLDHPSEKIETIPFAMYASPFAGHQQVQARGSGDSKSEGPVAYGMFSIPKVGTEVLVACIDGNPDMRVWFAALYGYGLAGTMPHGRYAFSEGGGLDGPLTASGKPIQPLYDNYKAAFGDKGSPEWMSRGADYQVAAVGKIQSENEAQTIQKTPDNREYKHTLPDGTQFKGGDYTQGYAKSRIQGDAEYDKNLVESGKNYDPSTIALTSPGFHAFMMDDRPENSRIRLRTTSGHQIIFDDTNERIYIATAQGNNWIEMDQNGSIDIHSGRRVSIHSSTDINFTTEGTFRVTAKGGIHMSTDNEIRATAAADIHVKSGANIREQAGASVFIQSGSDMHVKSGGVLNLSCASAMNLGAGGNIVETGAQIHLNGPAAAQASDAASAPAFLTNRVPGHEPWARVMMDRGASDKSAPTDKPEHKPEIQPNDPNVGKMELGEKIERNKNWGR